MRLKNTGAVKPLWVFRTNGFVSSSPALGDIDGDGKLEVAVSSHDKVIYAINGEDGSLLWKYTAGIGLFLLQLQVMLMVMIDLMSLLVAGIIIPMLLGGVLWKYTAQWFVDSSPSLGDIDGDGKIEVVIGSWDGNIYALDVPSAGSRVYWQGLHGDPWFNSTRCLCFIDPDMDFLSTYSELLYDTDPHDPDTDNDFCLDGVEVYRGRNPLVFDNVHVLIPLTVLIVCIVCFASYIVFRKLRKARNKII